MPGRDDDHDSLTNIPSMVPESDELAARQHAVQRESPSTGRGGSFLWRAVVLVLLVGLAGFGVLLNRTSNHVQALQEQLASYQKQVAALRGGLSSTSETVSSSNSALKEQLDKQNHEIRKLWDNVWKRSKKELAAHDAQIDRLDAQLGQQDKNLKALTGKLSDLQLTVKVVSDQLDAAGDVPAKLGAIGKRIDKINGDVTSLVATQKKLTGRVNNVEGWVASFNAYRKQVNQKLLELQNDGGGAGTGAQ